MPKTDEESFPRGGKISRKRPPQEITNLFNSVNPKKQKKTKNAKRKKEQVKEVSAQSNVHIQGSLTYSRLQPGMMILGCIKHINNATLVVELPGLCSTFINITEISDSFTKNLNDLLENDDPESANILSKMFAVGEYLLVKILSVETHDRKTPHVEGTINPREIYSEYNHSSFKKGMLIWSAINSKADHGYELDTGVKGCRTFLPSKNIDDDSHYLIGKPIWCVVHRSEISSSASILRVSSSFKHIQNTTEIENFDTTIPGLKVELFVDKIISHGIQGTFNEHFTGYVGNGYLRNLKDQLSNFHEGQLLTAYILYVEPVTKIAHLSLRNLEPIEKPNLSTGDLVIGEVFSKTYNGYFFLLDNKYKGFVTNKRLTNTLNKNSKLDDALSKKYPLGSKHQCRILDYNRLLNSFICTTEPIIVNETEFSSKDLILGQRLLVNIKSIVEQGIVVTYKNISGFITNLHISDAEYTENLKKKFVAGQKIAARVLSIEDNNVLFTIKPSLVKCDENLTTFQQAEIGKGYQGVVVKVENRGNLIAFYGKILGLLSHPKEKKVINTKRYFYRGQVVRVFIKKIRGKELVLSLFEPKEKSLPKIGSKVDGTVESVDKDGVHIKIKNMKIPGFIPNSHLTVSLSLCNGFKNTLNIGEELTDLLYFGGSETYLLSRRESIIIKDRKVLYWRNVKEGELVRCYYQSPASNGIYVLPLLQGLTEPVRIAQQGDAEKTFFSNLKPYQVLIARCSRFPQKNLHLSVKVEYIINLEVEDAINYFIYYLNEFDYLKEHARINGWNITEYQPGSEVDCSVEKIDTEGCIVSLPNGAKGLAAPTLCPKKLKVNTTVKGKVISYDFDKQFVEICLKQDKRDKINEEQTGTMDIQVPFSVAEKLLVKSECIVAVLRHPRCNKQLIYLPVKSSDNDFLGFSSYYNDNKFKVCICGKVKGNLMGMSKRLFLKLDKQKLTIKEKQEKLKKTKNITFEEIEDNGPSEETGNNSNGIDTAMDVDVDNQLFSEEQESDTTKCKPVTIPALPSYFNGFPKAVDSPSEDEIDEPTENKKKKKITPAERIKHLKEEEEKISKIERELADTSKPPETAEQFDRLLLAKPNSSELWIKYISFHIAVTELEKARTVAQRALSTINMTELEERFNIWIVLLNLENTFGTEDSFEKVLEDALKFNDPLKIYLRVIQIFGEEENYDKMEEKIKKVKSKYKQDATLWQELGRIYYQLGKFEEARNCKDCALRSITDKKTQMNIIVRFAIMEFKYGEEDQGCAIFETILTSDPKKINIWIIYVDQLVKKERIEQARQVLERSVFQKLPLKSMKSLFMKYRKFEEEYGTPETLKTVMNTVQDYIAKFEK